MTQIRVPITGVPGAPGADGAPGPAGPAASTSTIAPGSFQAGQYVFPGRLRVGLPTDAFVIANPPRAGYPIEIFGGDGSGDANILLTANQNSESSQWSGNPHRGVIGMSADGGLRMSMNHFSRLSDGAWVVFETGRPACDIGTDSAGTFSYRYDQPSALGTGVFSGVASQTFVIHGAGQDSAAYEETQVVDIMTMQGGRFMRFRTCAVTNNPLPVIEFQGDQTIWWYQKMIGPVGTAGRAPFRLREGVAPTTPENGDVWMTSAGLFYRAGGVTVGPLS